VHPASTSEKHYLQIFDAVESDRHVSQRSLASELGIALGLANLLVKRLVRKGWLRVIRVKPNRVRYLITPAGVIEKSRMTRAYFNSSVQFYRQTRHRIQQRLSGLSARWPDGGKASVLKRIIFYGAGEVAEIGYVCLVETDLQLVGVVDPLRTKPFFGLSIRPPSDIDGRNLAGQAFDRMVVMSFGNPDALVSEISALRVPAECVVWL